ncbi:hypothetical protein SCLCIDRAFT_1210100 [Scleroderma citrinum Foug A]|uniref:Uncharacterized protein n=1 Tax=Scleroderma citrinum Foug A TaxID=1036808 RepID=A0A0C3A2R2_9AGAM|nr:hypothetical protein SCLCIDRAFT_1210100 [Scleroderma citrinum Foug A]
MATTSAISGSFGAHRYPGLLVPGQLVDNLGKSDDQRRRDPEPIFHVTRLSS